MGSCKWLVLLAGCQVFLAAHTSSAAPSLQSQPHGSDTPASNALRSSTRNSWANYAPSAAPPPSGIAYVTHIPGFTSDLPVVVLLTPGVIGNDQRKVSSMAVGRCQAATWQRKGCLLTLDSEWAFQGDVGVQLRGRSSQAVDKKQYSLHMLAPGANSSARPVPTASPLMGMPSAVDWVLYGPYMDRSMLRDALAYDLARATGHWAPNFRYVELFLAADGTQSHATLDYDKTYRGVYMLLEHVSRGGARVNVSRLQPPSVEGATADWVTGGYILQLSNYAADQWYATENHEETAGYIAKLGPTRVDFVYPKSTSVAAEALQYIRSYVQDVDRGANALRLAQNQLTQANSLPEDDGSLFSLISGASGRASSISTADAAARNAATKLQGKLELYSWIDFFLHNELSNDYDAYVSSVYLFKDRGERLSAGPIWDKNLAFGNEAEVTDPRGGWRHSSPEVMNSGVVAGWIGALAGTPGFASAVVTRWKELRAGSWSDAQLGAAVDKLAAAVGSAAAARNSARWPPSAVSSNSQYVQLPPALPSWHKEVSALRVWLLARAAWMDSRILLPQGPDLLSPHQTLSRPLLRSVSEGLGLEVPPELQRNTALVSLMSSLPLRR